MSLEDKIKDIISVLGVSGMTEIVGVDKVERLHALGIAITNENLANFLAKEIGLKIFKNTQLRLDLLASLGRERIGASLGLGDDFLAEDLVAWNNFRWGNNAKSRLFLSLFAFVPSDYAVEPVARPTLVKVDAANPLHRYQDWVRRRALVQLSGPSSRFLVHMPTGAGKTRTTIEIVIDFLDSRVDPNTTAVWFAHSEELCEQAASAFEALWPKRASSSASVIRLWGGTTPPSELPNGPRFIVTSFSTAYKMLVANTNERFRLVMSIKASNRLIIVDEAHQSTAPTYREAIELFANRDTHTIGLTATPGRHGVGADATQTEELSSFFYSGKLDMPDEEGRELDDPIEFLTSRGVLSQVERYRLNSNEDFRLSASELGQIERHLDIPKSVLSKIGASAARTSLVAATAAKLAVEERSSVLVFAPSKENAVELATLLSYRGIESHAVTGETHEATRAASIKAFRDGQISVLTNFAVLSTGFDAPRIDSVIIARPTTSVVLYSQMIGRGLRGSAMGGTKKCRIIDVIDNINNLPSANQAFTFFNHYYPPLQGTKDLK